MCPHVKSNKQSRMLQTRILISVINLFQQISKFMWNTLQTIITVSRFSYVNWDHILVQPPSCNVLCPVTHISQCIEPASLCCTLYGKSHISSYDRNGDTIIHMLVTKYILCHISRKKAIESKWIFSYEV